MKTKNYTHRTKDIMLTCRFPSSLVKLVNKVSSRLEMTRSEYIRNIVQKEIDATPVSYKN
jgi:metal-responsive CopG/Arc/MetJ family transcriptional regulator